MKKIFVIGDPCVDWLIYKDNYQPPVNTKEKNANNWENSQQASMNVTPGGVLLLAHFLKKIASKSKVQSYEYGSLNRISNNRMNSYAEVEKYKPRKGDSCYRISEFLGFGGTSGQTIKSIENFELKDIQSQDTLVIDDSGNELRKKSGDWIRKLSKVHPLIIHKINWPLSHNNLLTSLADKHSQKHIVIISAQDLRRSGVQLSHKQSWDQTIEDFIDSYNNDARFKPFKRCNHLIIRFGLEGVIYLRKETKAAKNSIPNHQLKAFYYQNIIEGQLKSKASGSMQGLSYAFISGLVKSLESTTDQAEAIEKGIIRGMDASKNCLRLGFLKNRNGKLEYAIDKYLKAEDQSEVKVIDLNEFCTKKDDRPTLLLNQTCGGVQNTIYGAIEIATKGKVMGSLTSVPFVKFGGLTSPDRDEIESYRSVQNLMETYVKDLGNQKPLSIAVFGPPGSGKSFGVKQIANMFDGVFEKREFNLSQFNSYDDLTNAFQTVRDINLSGKLPLVFFDEFDSSFDGKKLGWLKYFLAPMQDGEFKEGGSTHPIGRGVFVFAGGTAPTYELFEKPSNIGEDDQKIRKELKVPDFLSRLRGYINVKGINQYGEAPESDKAYVIRRSLVLNFQLSQLKSIINKDTREISIDPNLLRAFLKIPKYKHGVRSMESIIKMSNLDKVRIFSRSCLPPDHLLKMHVDINEFKKELFMNNNWTSDPEFLDCYGQKAHELYVKSEKDKGESKKTNEYLVAWNKLPEEMRESNRQQGVDATLKLSAHNYGIRPKSKGSKGVKEFPKGELESMSIMEHERWMIEKQKNGWVYAPGDKDPDAKTNPCLVPWRELPEVEKKKDRQTIEALPHILEECGYEIYKLKE